jgi:hypothetical protein
MTGKPTREDHILDREKLENGARLDLLDLKGNKTGAWVMVRSKWNDSVKFAIDDTERALTVLLARSGKVSTSARAKMLRKIIVEMVAGWSFSDDPTDAEIDEWLRDAPHHAYAIDDHSGNTVFFQRSSGNSSNGLKKKSG